MVWKLSSSRSRVEPSALKPHSHPQRVAVHRQQSGYAKRFPFAIRVSNAVLSLPDRHSALSVRHIESADRKRGSRICLEFPLLSPYPCRPPTIACFPLKLTIQISPRVLDYDLRPWRWGDGHARHPRYLPNVKYLLRRNELDIAPLFVIRRMFVQFRDIAHAFLKEITLIGMI